MDEVYDISCHTGNGAEDPPDSILMEVKYDNFLPEIIRLLLQIDDVRQRAFSKYAACRRFG